MKRKILQIVPAPPGLVTAFYNEGASPDLYPVVLFALCELEDEWGNPYQEIVPLDVGGGELSDPSWIDSADECLGIFAPDNSVNRKNLEGANRFEAERRLRKKEKTVPRMGADFEDEAPGASKGLSG